MTNYFERLGRRIQTHWQALARPLPHAFAELAFRALSDEPPHEHTSLDELVAWLFDPRRDGTQPALDPFGQPPITVFRGGGFRIEALVWRAATTSIHQHSFAGAFTPLIGASAHTTFSFHERERVMPSLRVGELRAHELEILRPGCVRAIVPGAELIHQVFHLDSPTVTIVARTDGMAEYQPQLRYELPGVAVDPEPDPCLARRLAMLHLLADTDLAHAGRVAADYAAGAAPDAVFHVVCFLAPMVARSDIATILDAARPRLGELTDVFERAAEHRRRVEGSLAVRAAVRDRRVRFVTALLMLGHRRDDILGIVHREHPDQDAVSSVAGVLEQLAHAGLIGVELDDVNRVMLRSLLAGAGPRELLAAVEDEFDSDDVRDQRDELLAHARALCAQPLIAPVVDPGQWTP